MLPPLQAKISICGGAHRWSLDSVGGILEEWCTRFLWGLKVLVYRFTACSMHLEVIFLHRKHTKPLAEQKWTWYSHSRNVLAGKSIRGVADEKAGFSYGTVRNKNKVSHNMYTWFMRERRTWVTCGGMFHTREWYGLKPCLPISQVNMIIGKYCHFRRYSNDSDPQSGPRGIQTAELHNGVELDG